MSGQKYKGPSRFLKVLIALTLAFIWINSLLPRAESQAVSRGLMEYISRLLEIVDIELNSQNDHFLRKLAHFSEFGLLGAELCLLMYLKGRQSPQGFVNCAFAGLSAAVIDESLQLISKRGSQVQDVLLDFCGYMVGLWLCAVIYEHFIRKRIDKDKLS